MVVQENNLIPLVRVDHLEGSGKRLEYALYSCPSCGREKHLSLELKWKEKKGKKEEDASNAVLDNVVISDQLLQELRSSDRFTPAETESSHIS